MEVDRYTIIKVEVWPIDLPLIDPFVVATGSRVTAHNAYARITLAGGAVAGCITTAPCGAWCPA